jgi:hypothetical protein
MSAKAVRNSTAKLETPRTPSSAGFERELAGIGDLKEELAAGAPLDAESVERLRRWLGNRNNFLVSKAAKIVADREEAALLPAVVAAFDRFFTDPVKSDPKCWAKEELAKAMVKLGHRGKDEYLRGMRHHQWEPSFGPDVDSAGALRGTCAHALVDCPGISDAELLTVLLEPLTDHDKTVRAEGARAIAAVGGVSAALLMRLRAMLGASSSGTEEPEVLGAVYGALLSLEGAGAIPLVAAALQEGDDAAAEAAYALADLRSPEALAVLINRAQGDRDEWFGSVLLAAIATTRLAEAWDFLIAMIARDVREAPQAIEAIGRSAPSAELRERVRLAVEEADSMRLRKAFREHLPETVEEQRAH